MKNKLITLALIAALAVSSLSVSMAANSSSNDRGSSGGGGGSAPSTTTAGTTATTTNASGEQVVTTVTTAKGVTMKSMRIGSAGTTVNQSVQTLNGASVTIRQTTNAPTTAPNGAAVCTKAILVISQNGVTSGCFVDETTGRPLATGKDEVYMAYDENGNLVAHYVNAFGMFYTGVQVINGVQYTFNSEGVIIA